MLTMMLARRVLHSSNVAWRPLMKESTDLWF